MAYDPATNQWTHLQGLPSTRKSPVAGIIGNTIIVQGGEGHGPEPTTWIGRIIPLEPDPASTDLEPPSTDPAEQQRAKTKLKPRSIQMPVSLGEVAAGIINGKIYTVGEFNNATVVYNPRKNKFASSLARRPHQGHHHGAEVYDGKLYLIGGLGSGAGKVQIYDPRANSWSLGADMPFAAGSVSTAQIGNKIFVAGGIVGSRTTNLAAKYIPARNRWKMIAPMPEGRNHAASGTDGKRFYIFGGRGPGSGDANFVANGFDTVQVYNPKTNAWTLKEPLPQARGGTGKAVFANGRFYIMGGETSTGAGATEHRVYDRVDLYNPRTDAWSVGRPMITARHGIFPGLHDGVIYLPGGGVQAGGSHSNILEIYPV
jgi:N-acetylneuraminic acid mutarotase